MYGRKVKLRFLFVTLILVTLILTVFLILKSLEENVVFFQSPTEIKKLSELDKNKIRVGGMVKKNSINILTKSSIHSSMLFPLLLMTAAFALFSLLIFLMKYNTELIKIKNKGLDRL